MHALKSNVSSSLTATSNGCINLIKLFLHVHSLGKNTRINSCLSFDLLNVSQLTHYVRILTFSSSIFVSRAVATLELTRQDSVVIKDVISDTKKKLSVATVKSDELLEALTAKATALEKLKAKLGIGSATLSAFVALIDSEIEDDDLALLQVS